MKFIWNYIHRKLRDLPDEHGAIATNSKYATISPATADHDWSDGLNVRIHTAMGGRIVSFNRYDRKSDRDNRTVYVIPDDHDFEKELGKLITLESMRG